MKKLRRRVEAVRPHDRPRFRIDAHLTEVVEIAKRLAERSTQQERAIDLAHDPIVERDTQPVPIQWLNFGYAKHVPILRKRIDRDQRFERLRSLPVVSQLVRVESRPLTHESQGAWRQGTRDYPPRPELDLRDVLAVLGMEMRWRMIRSIHPDHDSVERGEARQGLRSPAEAWRRTRAPVRLEPRERAAQHGRDARTP